MSARTDALLSRRETGKTSRVQLPRYGRLSPGMPQHNRASRYWLLPQAVGSCCQMRSHGLKAASLAHAASAGWMRIIPTCPWIGAIGRCACRCRARRGRTIIGPAMHPAVNPRDAHRCKGPPNSGLGTVGRYRQDRPGREPKGQRRGRQECCGHNQSNTHGILRHVALPSDRTMKQHHLSRRLDLLIQINVAPTMNLATCLARPSGRTRPCRSSPMATGTLIARYGSRIRTRRQVSSDERERQPRPCLGDR